MAAALLLCLFAAAAVAVSPTPPRVLIFSLGDDYGFVSLALRSRPCRLLLRCCRSSLNWLAG